MRLLLDACVWGGSKAALLAFDHDVIWAGDWPEDPGDDAVLARANIEERILVTLDKDFGELAVIQGRPHRGIIRLVGISATRQAATAKRFPRGMEKNSLPARSLQRSLPA